VEEHKAPRVMKDSLILFASVSSQWYQQLPELPGNPGQMSCG
jgi:hypothetical protein